MRFFLLFIIFLGSHSLAYSQNQQAQIDSLKREILHMKIEVEEINFNLNRSRNKFKKGLLVATIGYAITITGGLMLGRKNDDLGKGLLVAGGVTGVTGTAMMLDAFNSLSRKKKRPKP
jgi:hypothetical protein